MELIFIERFEAVEVNEGEARHRKIWVCSFPHASLIAAMRVPSVRSLAFIDDPVDSVRFMLDVNGLPFMNCLHHQTGAAACYVALRDNPLALIVPRTFAGLACDVVKHVAKHIGAYLAISIRNEIAHEFTGQFENASLEDALRRRGAYYRSLENHDVFDDQQLAYIEQVLAPMQLLAVKSEGAVITWPFSLLIDGDTQQLATEMVVDLTGPPRYIFYGPYFFLPPGRWKFDAIFGFSDNLFGASFIIDVINSAPLVVAKFRADSAGIFKTTLDFVHERSHEPLEFRLLNEEGAIEGRVALASVHFYHHAPLLTI